MSLVIPSSPLENSVPAYIARRPKFLLSPPPPPKHKRAAAQLKLAQPPTPPYSRRAHPAATPRSPLSPLESFLNLLDTPSPYNSINKKHDIASASQLLNDLGYNIAIETFHAPPASTVPVTPRPTAAKSAITAYNPNPSAKTILLGMNILSRQHTNTSQSSAKLGMPLHSRSNNSGYEVAATSRPPIPPMMPDYSQQRRGSLPTSTSQNYPRSHSKSSSSRKDDKDINKAQNKRYPLPLPYSSVVEMDQILGDMRSAKNVAAYTSASTPVGSGAYSRGATQLPAGQVGTGRPYIGADGRMWRDREEELEYAGLLAAGAGELRRGSDGTTASLDDEGDVERQGRRQWAKFGRHAAPAPAGSSSSAHATKYDAIQASERRMRVPHSATESSDDEGVDEPWSPLVEPAAAQHQFPSYAFPASSKSSRASSALVSPGPGATGRVLPLPASMNDFAVPNGREPHRIHGVPKAKEDFLASAFAPMPLPKSRRSDREREREHSSSRPPTGSGQRQESRMTARRSSVQGVGANEIVVPLPSLRPHQPYPQSSSSRERERERDAHLHAPRSSSRPSTAGSGSGKEGSKEKSGGFLSVFKKNSK